MGSWREVPGLAAVLLVAGFLAWRPVLGSPTTLALGSPLNEGPRHLWALRATVDHMADWGPFVAHLDVDWPSGYTRHLMDPVNLLWFWPGYALGGPAFGFNAVFLGWTLVAGLGGWLLCRRLLMGHPQVGPTALLVALACATAPALVAGPVLGRTEILPGAAWPLHLWALDRCLAREGSFKDQLAAGLTLALVALGGWYLAGWLLLLEPPVALGLAWRHRGTVPVARTAGCFLDVALLAALPLLPALQALLAFPPPILSEDPAATPWLGISTPPWMLLPFTGSAGLPGVELPATPGLVLPLLALAGILLHPRRAAPWVGLALAVLALSLGPTLVWDTIPTEGGARLPAWYVEKFITPLGFIWGWCRIGILLAPPLALAGAFAVAELLERLAAVRWQVAGILAAALLVDHVQDRAPAAVAGRAFEPRPPTELVGALGAMPTGALLQLPFDDFYLLWQADLGRPLAESLEVEDVREKSLLVRTLLEGGIPGPDAGPDLARLGFGAVALHRDRLPETHAGTYGALESALGPARWESRDLVVWGVGPSLPGYSTVPTSPEDR